MLDTMCHEFVEHIPEDLAEGVLYVSIPFGTVVHRCACGCGEEVVTPLGPAEWRLIYDGRTVSLAPSIGNWSFACRSHYWIERGRVRRSRGFSADEVALVRRKARVRRAGYYGSGRKDGGRMLAVDEGVVESVEAAHGGFWASVWARVRSVGRGRGDVD